VGTAAVWACSRRQEDENSGGGIPTPGHGSYARYSSDLQDERSISDQQRKCRDRAASDGNEIDPELEFSDEAVSGAKSDRTGFEALMGAARAGRLKTLYLESLSRLARDSVLTLQTVRELVYLLKVRVVSIDDGIDTATSDQWELLVAIFGIQNEQYLRSLAKFVFRGQEGVVLDGLCVGDYCLGVKSEPIPGSEKSRRGRNRKPQTKYIAVHDEAAWVMLIFHWFVNDKRSLNWIAKELTRRGAPKDHRSTTKTWRHQQVADLLKNEKYIGLWPWGKMKNVRDPMTGKIRQVPRSPAETKKWLRHFPELQIIDNETFEKAQQRLRENAEAMAAARTTKTDKRGQRKAELNGSTTKMAECFPRHLLSQLIACGPSCGRKWHVSGKDSRYMHCPGYRMGDCDCGTTLRRDLAEELILHDIGVKILGNFQLRAVVLKALRDAWDRLQQTLPKELTMAEKALADVEQIVSMLLDRCERTTSPDLDERLRQRCSERDSLKAKVERLRGTVVPLEPPSEEWLDAQLRDLRSVLSGGGPAAAIALRKLLAGPIVVTEVRLPGKRRHYLQGRFSVKLHALATAVGVELPGTEGSELETTITIDFRKVDPHVELADKVKSDFDSDMSVDDILAKHGISYTTYDKAMDYWYESRGLVRPDGRTLRARLKGKQPDSLMDKIMELWCDDMSNFEIADQFGCCRDTVTAKVAEWHRARGLTVPDGRARRREIRLRKEQRGEADAA
jgi:DNA invertase Pin-like site-specific DNA recombinase